MLDKTQIKRVLKDHCHHLIKYNIDDEHWTDCIAQTLIEHEREVEDGICPMKSITTAPNGSWKNYKS